MTEENIVQDASNGQGTQKPEQLQASDTSIDQNANQQIDTSSDSSVDQNDNIDTPENLQALKGKVSQVEQERNFYSEDNKQLREQLEGAKSQAEKFKKVEQQLSSHLQSSFANNRQGYEMARAEYYQLTGTDPGSYDQVYGGSSFQNQNSIATNQPQYSPESIDQMIQKGVQKSLKEQSFLEGADTFLKENPDLDHRQFETNSYEHRMKENYMIRLSNYVSVLTNDMPNLTIKEAFERAHSMLNIDQVKKQERLIGQVTGRKNQIGSDSSIGNPGNSTVVVDDTPVKWKSGQKDHYERLKAKDPKRAERYRQAAIRLNS